MEINDNKKGISITISVILIIVAFAWVAVIAYYYNQYNNQGKINDLDNVILEKNYIGRSIEECSVIKFSCKIGYEYFLDEDGCGCINSSSLEAVRNYFITKMQDSYISNNGHAIEGFIPIFYLDYYRGLVIEDFEGVEAEQGIYIVSKGNISFVENEVELHTAARAITRNGMLKLLSNLEKRLNIEVKTKENVDILLSKISQKANIINDSIVGIPGDYEGIPEDIDNLNYCSSESRNVEACTMDYNPVCGYVQVECIKAPCYPIPKTYSNSCIACQNNRVTYYSSGECNN